MVNTRRRRRRRKLPYIQDLSLNTRIITNRNFHSRCNLRAVDPSILNPNKFVTNHKLLSDGFTLSVYNSHESKYKLYLHLTQDDQEIFNSRYENCQVQVLIRVGQITKDGVDWHKVPTDFFVKINRSVPAGYGNSPVNIANFIKYWPHSSPLLVELFWQPKLLSSYVVAADWLLVINPSLFKTFIVDSKRKPDYTLMKIRATSNDNDELKIISQEFSLLCPLTMRRLKLPVQGIECNHIQCFDGDSYLELNLAKPKWICPICRKITFPGSLVLDGFWVNVLDQCLTNSIFVHSDGSWTSAENSKEGKLITALSSEIICL